MNSLSNNNCNGGISPVTTCTCPPRFAVCPSQVADLHPLPCPAILTCGTGEEVVIADENIENKDDQVEVASVTIDTTCLCFPTVKIEFSSIIKAEVKGGGDVLRAKVVLRRVCGNQTTRLETFNLCFNKQSGNNEQCIPFGFIFCDETNPSAECTYEVVVTRTEEFKKDDKITFESVNIAALAVGCAKECK